MQQSSVKKGHLVNHSYHEELNKSYSGKHSSRHVENHAHYLVEVQNHENSCDEVGEEATEGD